MLLNLPTAKIIYSKKKRFDGIFHKPSHPDGLKTTDLGGKPRNGSPGRDGTGR